MSESEVAAILGHRSSPIGHPTVDRPASSADSTEHDFGPILAHGQELRHEFRLTNPTSRPVRLLKAQAHTPCCSAVGPLPKAIPPGGSVAVPILFKPGFQTGLKRVEFSVQTDSPDVPGWLLGVTASLTAEVEATLVKGSDTSLPLGKPGRQVWRVAGRRVGDEGRGEPVSLTVASPLTARWLGPAVEARQAGGLIETTREVEVTLPASKEIGSQQDQLHVRWADEKTLEQAITWHVRPRIQVAPSGLVLRPSTGSTWQAIVLRCEDRPFQITKLSGGVLAEGNDLPSGSKTEHRLRLVLNPARMPAGTSDIEVATDHPEQPTVVLSVLILSSARGDER